MPEAALPEWTRDIYDLAPAETKHWEERIIEARRVELRAPWSSRSTSSDARLERGINRINCFHDARVMRQIELLNQQSDRGLPAAYLPKDERDAS